MLIQVSLMLNEDQNNRGQNPKIGVQPQLCKMAGMALFSLGFVGLFLPLLPTTIFWIGAAWLFAKGHPEWRARIYAEPRFGPIVENFLERGQISESAKNAASFGIVGVGGLSLLLTGITGGLLLAVLGILAAVIIFIHSRPSQ